MVFQVIGSLFFRVAIVDTLYQVDKVKQVAIVASMASIYNKGVPCPL